MQAIGWAKAEIIITVVSNDRDLAIRDTSLQWQLHLGLTEIQCTKKNNTEMNCQIRRN